MQVSSLISRLQTDGAHANGVPGDVTPAAGSCIATKGGSSMRPSKRPSSNRLGLNQSENEKAQPPAEDQERRCEHMNYEAMVEVSQRVGYD
jgi:hypothetical protein